MAWYEDLVTHTPGVQGGAPVLKGTRTPVGSVISYLRTYDWDRQEVRAALPHLTAQQIEAAIAYYEHHQAEADADLQRHIDARERLLRAV